MSSAFTKVGETKIEGIQAVAELYIHKKHGCPFLNIKNNDTNNFFISAFRTYPENDKGIAHVTEHMVLHGSEKYPITDVFGELDKRSINTYLNAFTYPDMTCFPVGSANEVDFHNIMDVYLDCVLRPKFRLENFLSECHHIEFQEDQDPKTPLIHAGVVYNEMKGVYSSADSYFEDSLLSKVGKGTIYQNNYGGDPKEIRNLTRDELVEFHKRFYHPSMSMLYHYGSFDEEKIMKHIDEAISSIEPLKEEEVPKNFKLVPEPRTEQEDVVIEGPLDSSQDSNAQIRSALTWIIGDSTDRVLLYDFDLIESILLGSRGSPLFEALVQGGIGTSFLSEGLSDQTKGMTFTVGLKGMTKESLEKFQEVTMKTLQKLVDEGIPQDTIDAGLQHMLLSKKAITANQGINIFININHPWAYGLNPLNVIDNSKELDDLKKRVTTNPRYLEKLIEEKLLKNANRVKLVQMPSEEFSKNMKESEKIELEKIRSTMTPEDDKKCMELAKKLKDVIFNSKDSIDKLPCFEKKDLEKKCVVEPEIINNKVHKFVQGTNGIDYVRLELRFPINPKINNKLITFMARALKEIGSKEVDEKEFALMKQRYSLDAKVTAYTVPINDDLKANEVENSFTLTCSTLSEDVDMLIKIIKIMSVEANFDNKKRLEVILKEYIADISEQISTYGYYYANLHSSRTLSRRFAARNIIEGEGMLRYIKNDLQKMPIDELSKQLKEAFQLIMGTVRCEAFINCTEADMEKIAPKVEKLVEEINKLGEKAKLDSDYSEIDKYIEEEKSKNHVFFDTDDQTNYLSSVTRMEPLNEEVGKFYVAAKVLEEEFINPEIRQKLGAYGAYVSLNKVNGSLTFFTYRDGTPAESYKAIIRTLETAADKVTDTMVDHAVLQVAKELDLPLAPSMRGYDSYSSNITPEYKQLIRDSAFSATKDEVKDIINRLKNAKYISTAFGNKNNAPEDFEIEKF